MVVLWKVVDLLELNVFLYKEGEATTFAPVSVLPDQGEVCCVWVLLIWHELDFLQGSYFDFVLFHVVDYLCDFPLNPGAVELHDFKIILSLVRVGSGLVGWGVLIGWLAWWGWLTLSTSGWALGAVC